MDPPKRVRKLLEIRGEVFVYFPPRLLSQGYICVFEITPPKEGKKGITPVWPPKKPPVEITFGGPKCRKNV